MRRKKIEISKTTVLIVGVMITTIMSRMLGMLREMAIADVYGASMESDAIVLALNIPSTLVAFMGSAIGDTYIPYYNSTDIKERMRVSNNLFWFLVILGGFIAGSLCFFPQIVVRIFAVGFSEDKMDLACRLVRVVIWCIIPILLAKLLGAYLQVQQSFAVVNATGILINLFAITVIYLSSGKSNIVAYMGTGVCLGYYLQFIILCIAVVKKNWFFSRPQRNGSWGIGNYMRMGVPVLFSAGVNEIQGIIDKNFASILADGVMSNINYASKINGIVYSIMLAISTVLFPKLTGLNDAKQKTKLIEILRKAISYMYMLILPISIGCMILAEPIVRLLFERGSFTRINTLATAFILRLYAIEFMAICLSPLVIRVFYALNDMKTPLLCSCIAVAINSTLDFVLMKRWQQNGLIVATVVADGCLCIMLFAFLFYKYKIKLLVRNNIWGISVIGSVLMGIYVWWIYGLTKSYMDNIWGSIGILGGIVISAIILYGAMVGIGIFLKQKSRRENNG